MARKKRFCKPVRSSLVIVKNVLGEFADESGLVANGCKSQVFFGGVDRHVQFEMADALGVRLGTLPVRYLGVPLHSKRLRAGDFQPLLNSVQKAISSRQARHISYVGRCQIIKSVLESIVRFWMQVISLPKYVTRRITSMCRSYLWCGEVDHRKSPIAWARVCRDRDEGGLGFKELLAWNRALLFRLVFVISSEQQNIWVSWARANLIRGKAWTSPACAGSSCLWRAAVHARDMVLGKLNGVIPATARLTGSNGKYDTKKVYSWLHPPGPKLNWCGVIWHGIQARKWAFTCWMATLNRLPTKTRLYKWGLVADEKCALCGNANEDVQHLWCECDVVRDIATRVLDWVGIQARFGTLLEWWDWFSTTTKRKNNIYLSRLLAVMSIVYFTWKLRNDVIYNGRQIDTVRVSREIIDSCRVRMVVKLRIEGRRGRALMKRLFQN